MIKNLYRSSCKVPFIIVRLKKKIFLDRFSKIKAQISNFMKIRPVGAELFHAQTRTDLTKLTVDFHKFRERA